MSKSRLVTPSLFSSINWARNAPPSWRERAFKSLYNMLARIWDDSNPWAQRGIEFERAVYRLAECVPEKINASEFFKDVVREVRGGQFQRKTKKFLELAGERYCLYGKIDVWFPDRIIDIKTTSRYKDKYLQSMQHKMYCFCENIPDFRYLVVEFLDDDSNQITGVHRVDYHVDDPASLEAEIRSKILDVLAFLESDEKLYDLYLNTYSLY